MVLPFVFPAMWISRWRVQKETKNQRGECPPPDSDPLSALSLEKTSPVSQANLPEAPIADPFPEKQSAIHQLADEALPLSAIRVNNPHCSFRLGVAAPLLYRSFRSVCGAGPPRRIRPVANLPPSSPPLDGLATASWALTFWICAACSFTVATRALISLCCSASFVSNF